MKELPPAIQRHLGNAYTALEAAVSALEQSIEAAPPSFARRGMSLADLQDGCLAMHRAMALVCGDGIAMKMDDPDDDDPRTLFNRLLTIENANRKNLAGIEGALNSLMVAALSLGEACSEMAKKRKLASHRYRSVLLVCRAAVKHVEHHLARGCLPGNYPFDVDKFLAIHRKRRLKTLVPIILD